MRRRWIAVLLIPLLGGCAGTRLESRARQTAHETETFGDGYRDASDPEAIVDLLTRFTAPPG